MLTTPTGFLCVVQADDPFATTSASRNTVRVGEVGKILSQDRDGFRVEFEGGRIWHIRTGAQFRPLYEEDLSARCAELETENARLKRIIGELM
jgi:hypothetical protein